MTEYNEYQGYQPGNPTPEPETHPVKARGLAMQERDPVVVWLILPVITIGIYSLVWFYKLHNELNQFDTRRSVSPVTSVLVLLFLGWLIVPVFIITYTLAKRVALAQKAAGLPVTCSPAAASALMLVLGIGVLYIQSELNKVIAYQDTPPGEQVPLYV